MTFLKMWDCKYFNGWKLQKSSNRVAKIRIFWILVQAWTARGHCKFPFPRRDSCRCCVDQHTDEPLVGSCVLHFLPNGSERLWGTGILVNRPCFADEPTERLNTDVKHLSNVLFRDWPTSDVEVFLLPGKTSWAI